MRSSEVDSFGWEVIALKEYLELLSLSYILKVWSNIIVFFSEYNKYYSVITSYPVIM